MAVLGSTLLPLGLFLCLVMLLIPTSSANFSDSCMLFTQIIPSTTAPGIKANSDVYESDTTYTISVPVNSNVDSVVLRAMDMNNKSLGLWHKADRNCNSSSLYHVGSHDTLLRAYWESPHSMNITAVNIQAFTINSHGMATFSSLTLKRRAITTKPPVTISTTKPPTTRALPTVRILNATATLTTTSSVANGIFLSPIADALQILFIFLTSKLLF